MRSFKLDLEHLRAVLEAEQDAECKEGPTEDHDASTFSVLILDLAAHYVVIEAAQQLRLLTNEPARDASPFGVIRLS